MASDSSSLPRGRSIRLGLRRYVHGLRTEGGTPRQEIAAIGAGVFIGCLPFYGFHLLICWAVGWLLGLNRVKMYLAANISNPFVAPWLLFLSCICCNTGSTGGGIKMFRTLLLWQQAKRELRLMVHPQAVEPVRIQQARGAVAFEDVSFRYDPERPLIDGLSLDVAAGRMVAIVGPTGAGKTTLVNLLMRFYELDGGRITIDGVDTRDLTRDDLRRQFGMVLPQRPRQRRDDHLGDLALPRVAAPQIVGEAGQERLGLVE